jgi:predicted nucleic acid-binding protein
MIVIPDANVIISALIKRGETSELFRWNDLTEKIRFAAPESLSLEVRRNILSIEEKTGLSESDIIKLLEKIESQIEFVPLSTFEAFIKPAMKVSPPNDFPYIALALFLKSKGNQPIVLSNDKDLLKALSKVNVESISIHELLFKLKLV